MDVHNDRGVTKLIVAGGRDFYSEADYRLLSDVLDNLFGDYSTDELVVFSGGAQGADTLGEGWAKRKGFEIQRFPAGWSIHGKADGPMRNKQMAELADALVLFWDGESKGSKNMLANALKQRLDIVIIHYDKKTQLSTLTNA